VGGAAKVSTRPPAASGGLARPQCPTPSSCQSEGRGRARHEHSHPHLQGRHTLHRHEAFRRMSGSRRGAVMGCGVDCTRLQPRRASPPLPAPVAAPVRLGSTPTARCTTAPVTGGTARPNTAAICPKRRRGHRALGRTTVRLAPRRPIEESVRPLPPKPTSIGLARHRTRYRLHGAGTDTIGTIGMQAAVRLAVVIVD
jgi:hypothetical protein